MTFDILGFGACSVDDILYVDEFPQPNGKTRVQQRLRAGGGLAGTALVAASRLGAGTGWCGVLGDEELSRFTRDELRREGVDISQVRFDPEARPHYSVVIVNPNTGSRSVLACRDGVTPFPSAEVSRDLIAAARMVFVDHTALETAIHAARWARELAIPVVADIERVDSDSLAALLPLIDHLIVGLETASALTGAKTAEEALPGLMHKGTSCAAVTDGERGCWFLERGAQIRHQPAFAVPAVDTTGCGDVFHGAYMASLLRGESIDEAVRFASAVAALKATKPGGRSGIPSRPEAEQFLAAYSNDK